MSKTGMPQRAISVLLACALACTMVPATGMAYAAEPDGAETAAAEQVQAIEEVAEPQTTSDDIQSDDTAANEAVPERVNEVVPVVTQQDGQTASGETTADPDPAAERTEADVDMLTTSVNLNNAGTVLSSNGLTYQVNADNATVSVVGWTAPAPKGALAIPSQVVVGTNTYKVTAVNNVRGGVHR